MIPFIGTKRLIEKNQTLTERLYYNHAASVSRLNTHYLLVAQLAGNAATWT